MNAIFRKISRFIRPIANLIGGVFPVENRKIVVSHFSGKGYGDNPKYIVNELLKQNANARIIWIIRDEEDKHSIPKGVECCLEKTFMSTYHLRTAKVWIADYRMAFRYKRKNQFYLQTWHGFALKRIEKDAQNNLSKGYVNSAIRDSKHIDIIVSCSKFMTEIYKKSFWYDGKILEFGAPRNDIILKNDVEAKNKVINYFGIKGQNGIVLYAPTFRVDRSLKSYSLDFEKLKAACEQRFGREFVILVRLHPNISNMNLDIDFDRSNIFNATLYQDMQELLCAADIVISDYSSLMFDFALSKKPCFMFATDIDEYKQDRNFYFDLEELPFSIAESNERLRENILNFENDRYVKLVEKFFKSVGMVFEGQASKKCAELILEIIKK